MTGLLPHQYRGQHQRKGRSQAGYGQLKAHGKRHRPAAEPFGNAARNGRSGNLAAQAEEHAAHIGHR